MREGDKLIFVLKRDDRNITAIALEPQAGAEIQLTATGTK